MLTPYTMPKIPNRYPLDKNDKLGLLLGTLLSGGLGYAGSKNTGEDPWARALAGGVAGFGMGGKALNDNYSSIFDDYLKGEGMDLRNRQMTQEQQQFQDTLGLNREKFGEERRQYEESEKPYKEAVANRYRAEVDYDKIRDEQTKRRLGIKLQKQKLSAVPTEEKLDEALGKLMAHKANYTSNINYDRNSPAIKQYTDQLDKQINVIQGKLKSLYPSKYDAGNEQDAKALEEMIKLLNQQ